MNQKQDHMQKITNVWMQIDVRIWQKQFQVKGEIFLLVMYIKLKCF